ncbi:hypothetical protein ETB97_003908 [Aspergillus alliaceus]|uniref:Uncharacterized protein n=1 Tax=Petromyces alliaceus TaxID=209559 RepID=A0A8H6E416_PETAA|nr:hypothetical protein ETB97_003908 [Aspergillus burnettii]
MTETSTSGTGRDIAERGTGQLFQSHPIELEKTEGKRYQNRLTQHELGVNSASSGSLQWELIYRRSSSLGVKGRRHEAGWKWADGTTPCRKEWVKVLLERTTDLNATDYLGRTELFLAVQSESETVAKLLLEASIDMNWKDTSGNVALHLAIERGSESLTLLLLKYGANIDA